jgi:hypothetical protein
MRSVLGGRGLNELTAARVGTAVARLLSGRSALAPFDPPVRQPQNRTGQRLSILTLLSLLGASQPALAELTAERMLKLCDSKVEAEEIACRYYLFGVYEGLAFGDSTARGPNNKMVDRDRSHFCPPDNATADQLISIFKNAAAVLAKSDPEVMKEPVLGIVDAALGHAFPCKK